MHGYVKIGPYRFCIFIMALFKNLINLGKNTLARLPILYAGVRKMAGDNRANDAILHQANTWIYQNNQALAKSARHWHIDMPSDLKADGRYLMISNHVSWADTAIIQYISQDRLPLTRFFIKKNLVWLPIVGQAFYFLDFPMMRRHSREALQKNPALAQDDVLEARRACALMKDTPFVLLNFVEGTRFNIAKHSAQRSPYRHLLKPKAGGFALAMASLGDDIDGILDLTLVYDGAHSYIDLWNDKVRVSASVRHLSLPSDLRKNLIEGAYHDPSHSAHFATKNALHTWLDDLWTQKDHQIAQTLATL